MAYAYFHKTDEAFQFVSLTQQDCDWNYEYEIDGATTDQIYELQDGVPVLVGAVDTSAGDPKAAFVLNGLREDRNRRLKETDWWANSDLTMTAEQTAYRQALRDITDTYTSLEDVVWPTKP